MPDDSTRIHGRRTSLIDDAAVFAQAIAMPNLEAAWSRVFGNGGAAGGDNVTLTRFQATAPIRLARLHQALTSGEYTPGAIRHVDIPKKDGGTRTLSIPSVVDRVTQTALTAVLTPLIDVELEDASFAYRIGRSVQAAVERIRSLHAAGYAALVDADIEHFFDNVPHDRLLARLAETMTDGPVTRLINLWLEHGASGGRGIPQGSPISPLLANLYLDRLDEAFAGRGARIVRFADDFVILTQDRSGAEAAWTKVEKLLAEQGLTLNRDKSRITSFDQGFHFLGHLFVHSLVMAGQGEDEIDEATRLMRHVAEEDRRTEAKAEEAAENDTLQRRHGLDPGQRILYVVSPDRRLTLRNQAFSVQAGSGGPGAPTEWHEILALPPNAVDRIELGPKVSADMTALRHALATDTPIAFVNGHGETAGWLAPHYGARAARHLAQAGATLNPDSRLVLARKFVEGRVRNHRALLRRLNRDRQEPLVLKTLATLNMLVRDIGSPKTLAELLGHEGRAAALFWPAFGRLLEGGFNFRLRQRDNPPDGVNILLNITANLLTRDITVAIERAGLHPGFGMLHAAADRADAAVYDLMEEFRAPMAESVVAQALNTKALTDADFETLPQGGPHLKSSSYAKILRVYERSADRVVSSRRDGRRRTWRGIMVDQALLLAAHVENRGVYEPYVLDY